MARHVNLPASSCEVSCNCTEANCLANSLYILELQPNVAKKPTLERVSQGVRKRDSLSDSSLSTCGMKSRFRLSAAGWKRDPPPETLRSNRCPLRTLRPWRPHQDYDRLRNGIDHPAKL